MSLLLGMILSATAGTTVTLLDSGPGTFETADLNCGTVESGSATATASITLAGDVVASLDNLVVEVGGAHGSCAVSLDTASLSWDGGSIWTTAVAQSGSGESECGWFIDLAYAPSGFTRQLITTGTHDLEVEVTGELEDSCSKISARVTGDIEFGTDWDDDGYNDVLVGGDDCDDDDSAISPAETEVWYDGVDQDCDGNDDDQDGDGWSLADDCDDTDASVHPGAAESCDGLDQDCDGVADNDPIDGVDYYVDADGDGFGDPTNTLSACEQPTGTTTDDQDCDDGDASIHPGAEEICDGVDQDCDLAIDEDAVDGTDWYLDFDGDGYGDPGLSTQSCAAPSGYTGDASDCNDSDAAVNPSATEICDGFDNNCDGLIDDEDPGVSTSNTWYQDGDGDGYGLDTTAYSACNPDFGDSGVGGDCDDLNPDVNPGAAEVWYDGIDQDCDGNDTDQDGDGYDWDGVGGDDCDDEDADVNPSAPEIWYDGIDQDCDGESDYDYDGDGHDHAGYGGDDCDDADDTVFPGAEDLDPYDGVDQACDGDECDEDSDGYTASECGGDDCDDNRSDVHPDAEEIWYDGVDQNCDGNDDDQDGDGWTYLNDCDDTDPTVYPGAPGWDPDCSQQLEDESPDWTSAGLGGGEAYKGGGGCGCTATPGPSGAWWAAGLLGLMVYRRRDEDKR